MSYVCLSIPSWSTGAARAESGALVPVLPDLLAHAPRVMVGEDGLLWADARGLHAPALAAQLLDVLRTHDVGGTEVRAGTAATPIAAAAAATRGTSPVTSVRAGGDRDFLADIPVAVLAPDPRLANLLDGLGIETCGQLAVLEAESVEIRLGAPGVELWKLARADDERRLFREPVRALPSASVEWTDYTLRDSERLLFVVNSLLGSICETLASQGERALELSLVFALSDRSRPVHALRSARPTADRTRWFRLARSALERITLPDAVTGVSLRVESVTGNDGTQGDLFDRGFASAGAVETTLAQLADDQDDPVVAPRVSRHPLADRRVEWTAEDPTAAAARQARRTPGPQSPHLTLQLLPEPRAIAVVTEPRRDAVVPTQYRDAGRWHQLVDVAGPDCVSGGQWEEGYDREYFRGVREDGLLVWLYREPEAVSRERISQSREPRAESWFLHGWWD